jgi:hypothetical protein
MRLKKLASLLFLALSCGIGINAQQPAPMLGDITVKLIEPLNFATAIPLQNVRSVVTDTSNPAIPPGSLAVLQLQTLDGSYTLKMMGLNVGGRIVRTTSKAGVSMNGSPASGKQASLATGAILKFTLTDAAGNPGQPVARATPAPVVAPPASTPPASTASASGSYPFTIEGIGLRMPLAQLRAATSTAGSVKGLVKQGPTTYNLTTRDLSFQIEFTVDGHVRQYNVSDRNPNHLKETGFSGPLYEKLVKAFGPQSTWKDSVVYDLGESGGAYAIVSDQ